MKKFYYSPGRAQVENPKSGMKHMARLGPDLAARDIIGL